MASRVHPFDELPLSGESAAGSSGSNKGEREVVGLFEQFRPSVLRYVVTLGLLVQDGEEITQEVFLALFKHLRHGRPRHNLGGWIFSVAHNLALRRRNAYGFLRTAPQLDQLREKSDPSPNPEEQMLVTERQKRLMAIVDALPEQDRCCLYLRAEGLHYREIGRVLDMSLGSVSAALSRALARLNSVDGR
jgi:RNA polymerase sigma-70 factor, ECF subfamily